MLRALQRRPELEYSLRWQPFLLAPDIPRMGMPKHDYLIQKFGGEERATRLFATITDFGKREGIYFDFKRITRAPSSIDAHRLVKLASHHNCSVQVVERLFVAHFSEGHDIGDRGVLREIAASCGLDRIETSKFLDAEDIFEDIGINNVRVRRLGVNGVPCFVLNGRYAIAGAQEAEVLERLLDISLAETGEVS